MATGSVSRARKHRINSRQRSNAGLCFKCDNPREANKSRCKDCLKKQREYYYYKKKKDGK